MRHHFAILAAGIAIAGTARAQQPGDSAGGRGFGPQTARPRPYNRVITADAKTKKGMFLVHRVNDRLYFEIPTNELGKDELMVGRYTRAAAVDPNPPAGGGGG